MRLSAGLKRLLLDLLRHFVSRYCLFFFIVRKPGFDLRSRLGPKKSETKRVITKKIEVDARQELERQNRGKKVGHEKREARLEEEEEYKDDEEQDTGDNDDVVEIQDVKEAEIDAKILRIQRKNEEIRKRQQEIERDKMMHS